MKNIARKTWFGLVLSVFVVGSAFGGYIGNVYTVPENYDVGDAAIADHWLHWNNFSDAYYTNNVSAYGDAWVNQYVLPGNAWDNSAQAGWLVYAFQASEGQKITEFRDYITNTYITSPNTYSVYWTNEYDGQADPVVSEWNFIVEDRINRTEIIYPDTEKVYLAYYLNRVDSAYDTWWKLQFKGDAIRVSTADIPEPATLGLLAAGGLVAALRRRRK